MTTSHRLLTPIPLISIFVAFIIIITLSKLLLIGKGFLSFGDEFIYCNSGNALVHLIQFDLRGFLHDIFSASARPGGAILFLIPNSLQLFSAKLLHLEIYESANSYPLFIFNYIIHCLIMWVHFNLSNLILKNRFVAILSVLIYISLTNSYLYLRHAMPYDMSLLILYLCCYLVFKYIVADQMTNRKSLLIGGLSFFGYLIYPGYFVLYVIVSVIFLLLYLSKANLKNRISLVFYFVSGSILCLAFFEIMARAGQTSYLGNLNYFFKQGSLEETNTFIFKYLLQVEGVSGLLIILNLLLFSIIISLQIKLNFLHFNNAVVILFIVVIGAFLFYACFGRYFQMIFYGRLLHQYFPFLCIFSAYSLNVVFLKTFKKNNKLILLFISLLLVASYFYNFYNYTNYAYARDVACEINKNRSLRDVEKIYEYENNYPVIPENNTLAQQKNFDFHSDKIILVNACFFYPVKSLHKYHPYKPMPSSKLIFNKPHFLNFKAYQFEGFDIDERRNIDKMNLHIKIFSE